MLQTIREKYADNYQKLEKARVRYLSLCRSAIMCDRTNRTLKAIAIKMQVRGLYSQNRSVEDCCYGILRRLWKWDSGSGLTWHDWCYKNGWSNRGTSRSKLTWKAE